jgi:hypothetical protein
MTSERMIAANRSNGRRGCGPRTAAGKASSRRNALRHGLSVPLVNVPGMCAEVEKLARIIAGANADDTQLGHARMVAEAQLDLMRIRGIKSAIMNSLTAKVNPPSAGIFAEEVKISSEGGDAGLVSDDFSSEGGCSQELAMIPPVLRQLSRLERYECRAISRRRRAMRAFLAVQPSGAKMES